MADIDVSTMTGADLTGFREAMLRAGMEVCLGKADVDLATLGDTPITITASAEYVLTKIVICNYGTHTDYAGSLNVYSDPDGAGDMILNVDIFGNDSGYVSVVSAFNGNEDYALNSAPLQRSDATLYARVKTAEGGPLSATVLIFGIYADPA